MGINPWETDWGPGYSDIPKRLFLAELDKQKKFGKVIIDIGSGKESVVDYVSGSYKLLKLDISGKEDNDDNQRGIKVDVQLVADENNFGYKRALVKAARFLNIDPRNGQDTETADSIVFSYILNYIDYAESLKGFSKFLKPGGRFIIINDPRLGYDRRFSPKGLKDNNDLFSLLKNENFEIEEEHFPSIVELDQDPSRELVHLVARKKPGSHVKSVMINKGTTHAEVNGGSVLQ